MFIVKSLWFLVGFWILVVWNLDCLEPRLSWTLVVLNLVVLNLWMSWNFGCLELLLCCLEPLLFLHLLNLSMIFRSTELLFFYFEASFLLSCLSSVSSRILKLFSFYFEASFLLSYLSSRILMYFGFELFSLF